MRHKINKSWRLCNEIREIFCACVFVAFAFAVFVCSLEDVLQPAIKKRLVGLCSAAYELGNLFYLQFDRISSELVMDP